VETSPTFSRLDPAEGQVYRGVLGDQPEGDAMDERQSDYEKPRVVDYGDLVELTAEGSDGDCLDADFAAGTKKSSLTFSGC
jgi:hypothetical protein